MPSSILSRFKRSPSESSTAADGPSIPTSSPSNRSPFKRNNSSFRATPEPVPAETPYVESPTSPISHAHSENGSHFVEEFDETARDLIDGSRPRGYTAPALGTPKLVLTADGSSSPVSFGSSPHSERASSLRPGIVGIRRQPSKERLGLGIDTVSEVSLLFPEVQLHTEPVRLLRAKANMVV